MLPPSVVTRTEPNLFAEQLVRHPVTPYFTRMQICIAILLTLISLPLHARGSDAFYVWQQQWSENVTAAVRNEPSTILYPLVSVVPASGTPALFNIPWEELSRAGHCYIPVIRIPLAAFKRADLTSALLRLTAELETQMKPVPLPEIQFDLDCPTRLLDRYTETVAMYRAGRPETALSVTVLPTHLRAPAFRKLAQAVDYYVLQVHGLEVPEKWDAPAELLSRRTADTALGRAEALGALFKVALPCYAYELNFDPQTRRFSYLTAEAAFRRGPTLKKRTTARPRDLIELRQKTDELEHARGVIWFRLPVAGDRLCLPRETLAEIQAGKIPATQAGCTITQLNERTLEISFSNTNLIQHTAAVIELDWPEPRGSFDLYRAARTETENPGQLPAKLFVNMPAPGQSVKLGWFQATVHPKINVRFP